MIVKVKYNKKTAASKFKKKYSKLNSELKKLDALITKKLILLAQQNPNLIIKGVNGCEININRFIDINYVSSLSIDTRFYYIDIIEKSSIETKINSKNKKIMSMICFFLKKHYICGKTTSLMFK